MRVHKLLITVNKVAAKYVKVMSFEIKPYNTDKKQNVRLKYFIQ